MSLKARRIVGGNYSSEDTLEIQHTYTGAAKEVVHHIEVISGVAVTHGGGASADTKLHYKSVARDADGDGIIDYSAVTIHVVQAEKGTSVIKVVSATVLKSDYDDWVTADTAFVNDYITLVKNEDGTEDLVTADGAPDRPSYPTATVEKTGEITLVWTDDAFV